ncbi:MAG: hypothetical protein AAFV85_16915 [Cyanobacteria bacterium J06634_6]
MTAAYKAQSTDISVEADRFVFELLRQKSNDERMAMSAALSRGARELSLMGLKRTFSDLSPGDFGKKVAFVWLGHQWPDGFVPVGEPMSWVQDSLQLARQLHPIFEQVGVAYYITGGVAATAYGDPRTTRDLDVVINVGQEDLGPLIAVLEEAGFYVPGVEDMVSGRLRTLQIIHQETVMQADLMVSGAERWDALKFERRRLEGGVYFISPEDVVLNKLKWRLSSQSEKQWRDVLGVLKVQGERLDLAYMKQWADALGLEEDFMRACQEADIGLP